MKCKLCLNDNIRLLFVAQDIHGRHVLSKDNFDIFQCDSCKVTFTAVDVDVDVEYYKKYYLDNYYPQVNPNSLFAKGLSFLQKFSFNQRLKLIEKYRSHDGNRILEIGCARGEFLNFLPDSYDKCGVEINDSGYQFVKENYKDINIHNIRINDRTFDSSKLGKFDVIIMWHVFEHIEDPVIFTKNLSKLLVEGGVLIFEIPNRNSFGFNLTKRWWFHLDAPRHLFHYDRRSMRNLLQNNNLKIIGNFGNPRDYPQDLPASFYGKFKTNNFVLNFLLLLFVLPAVTIFRLIVSLLWFDKAELNTYIVKHNK